MLRRLHALRTIARRASTRHVPRALLLALILAAPVGPGARVTAQEAPAPQAPESQAPAPNAPDARPRDGGANASDAAEALERARASLAAARRAPGPRHPDAAAWRQALDDAQAAVAAAEGGPQEDAAVALLARTYQDVRWWVRALDTWTRLRASTGELTGDDLAGWREAASQVAFARYSAGNLAGAAAGFDAILALLPEDVEALRWAGRIALESGRHEDSLAYWTRLLELRPDDASARFYADVARERARYGREASDAFRRGLELYEAGEPGEALAAFEAARAAAPGWREPAWWRARTLLESGRSDAAVAAWEELAAAHPDDPDAAWFLQRARLEARVGRAAALAADEARAASEAGDPAAAAAAWSRAAQAAPDWLEARMNLARSALRAGDAATATRAFSAVLDHPGAGDAERAEARAGLEQAELQERLGSEAGIAYAEAIAAYERSDVAAAEAHFRRVVAAAPDFAEGWGWLGRLAFLSGDWATAASAYGRASELAPDDDDYAFFAQEARSLAGQGAGDEADGPEAAPAPGPAPEPIPAPAPSTPEDEP